MKITRFLAALGVACALWVGSFAVASAACPGPAVMRDSSGTSFKMSVATGPDGNCLNNTTVMGVGTKITGQATISTGGTPVKAITAAQNVHGYCLQIGPGGSNTDPLYFSDTSASPSATNGFQLDPSTAAKSGGSFCSPPNMPAGSDVWFVGATTGDKVNWEAW